jgi:UDP-N-acetylglucosamine diphosphorylase/glucosamine-1-phosphate N-acetyltransferase
VLFEDANVSDLGSIALTRPSFMLRCGTTMLCEKIARTYDGAQLHLLCRTYLADVLREELARLGVSAAVNDRETVARVGGLFVNGGLLPSDSLPALKGPNEVATADGRVAYARLDAGCMARCPDCLEIDAEGLTHISAREGVATRAAEGVSLVRYPWHLIIANAEQIEQDFEALAKGKASEGIIEEGAWVRVADGDSVRVYGGGEATGLARRGRLPLYVGKGAVVQAMTVLDLTKGPAYIGPGVEIRGPTIIDGPFSIGDDSLIDGAKIREGVTIGPVCKVGGEVEESIFQGYSNKHHDGFLGHAYVGEWINLGALATNSDLKNTYTSVDVYLNAAQVTGRASVDTGEYKTVGSYIGDHSKIGIGVMLNTGTHVGVACNLVGEMPPKYVPSFSWGSGSKLVTHRLDKMLQTADIVMGRRKRAPSEAYLAMMRAVYDRTEEERQSLGIA